MVAPQTVNCFPPTAEEKEHKLKAFINSIDPDAVCSLASRYNSSKPCRIFQDAANGSYNVCFVVEFDANTKWIVRIPSEPSIHNVWDKVQSEVATMQHLKAKTKLPIPNVHGFGRGGTVDEHNPTGLAYIILDYIPGRSLDILAFAKDSRKRKQHFYSQLIDILAQLRQQEFDYAGSLMPGPDGVSAPIIGSPALHTAK
ncbi:hypothetical protein DL764_008558 [Monosporascus ibericus]|uniref:Aminoglycoside phosphotransferase domain-containing protein n=1 Tax=Monosporascus ibericus TaxID=155417 RepID=A0A4Q4T0L6_9PEZI|nr:hypothetical protein DL764_008558 [Monosporascus ibericus]